MMVHAEGTIAGCAEDDERGGRRGRDERHKGAFVEASRIEYNTVRPNAFGGLTSAQLRARAPLTIA